MRAKRLVSRERCSAAGRLLAAGALLLPLLATGCASSKLNTARAQYYKGQFDDAATTLAELPGNQTDRVLVLMERGMIHQARTAYDESVTDWLRANELADELDLLSLSRSTTSMLVNDNVLAYCGAPYERVLLHSYAAQSYMALNLWQDAAVEGRLLIRRLENRGDYPDDPYSRYIAGLSLDLMGDGDGARFQYRKASEIVTTCSIAPATGALGPPVDTNAPAAKASPAPPPRAGDGEFICMVSIGRGATPRGYGGSNARWGGNPYAEFYDGSNYLGRSYTLMRTDTLFAATRKVIEKREAAKTAARIVLKESAADAVSSQNDDLGALVLLILLMLEQPDVRQWETLPQWMAVARLPCERRLTSYRIVLKSGAGVTVEERTVTTPIVHRGKDTVSLYRAL